VSAAGRICPERSSASPTTSILPTVQFSPPSKPPSVAATPVAFSAVPPAAPHMQQGVAGADWW